MGGPENGNFPLLYVVKMSLRRWVGLKTPLRNIKMAPYILYMFEWSKHDITYPGLFTTTYLHLSINLF